MPAREIAEVHGVQLIAQGDMVVKADCERPGGFEPKSVALWCELAKRGGLMIDGGAYTGIYSILAAKHGASFVIAFEACPSVTARLRDNVALNGAYGRVSISRIALWDRAANLHIDGRASLSSAKRVRVKTSVRGPMVPAIALDSLRLPNVTPNPLIAVKLDVERAEMKALAGMRETIRLHRPHVLLELLDGTQEAEAYFAEIGGYVMKPLDEAMYHFDPEAV